MDFDKLYQIKNAKCFLIQSFQSNSHNPQSDEFDNKAIFDDNNGMGKLFTTQRLLLDKQLQLKKDDINSKEKVITGLNDFFNSNGSQGSIIYFNGHGNKQGDWILSNNNNKDNLESLTDENQTMSFQELYNVYWIQRKNSKENSHLFLIIDCCSANKWIEYAKKYKLQDVSIITAQQKQNNGAYLTTFLKEIGSVFSIYFYYSFNPVFENKRKLEQCMNLKFKERNCLEYSNTCKENLFCSHFQFQLFSYMPQPSILNEKFNFRISEKLEEWSQLDEIRRSILEEEYEKSLEILKEIFQKKSNESLERVKRLYQLHLNEDECINPAEDLYVNVMLDYSEQSFQELEKLSQNQKQQSRKITFQFDQPYRETFKENFEKIIKLISQRNHISINLSFCQIKDSQFKIIVDQINQNTKSEILETLDLNLSFNHLTTQSLEYFQEIDHKLLLNLKNLFLNFAWNENIKNFCLKDKVVYPEFQKLSFLCLSFNQIKQLDGAVIKFLLTKYFSNIKSLESFYIHLEGCSIQDLLIDDLQKFIQENKKLLKFLYMNLRQNSITKAKGEKLKKINYSTNIQGKFQIRLSNNKDPSHFPNWLASIQAQNPEEQKILLDNMRSINQRISK